MKIEAKDFMTFAELVGLSLDTHGEDYHRLHCGLRLEDNDNYNYWAESVSVAHRYLIFSCRVPDTRIRRVEMEYEILTHNGVHTASLKKVVG